MLRLGNLLRRALVAGVLCPAAAICALAIAACGAQHKPPSAASTAKTKPPVGNNHTVWIYSSLPQGGPERADSIQVQQGIKLALHLTGYQVRGAAGDVFHIRYWARSDSRVVRHRHAGAGSVGRGNRTSAGTSATTTGNGNTWNATATVKNAEDAARNPQTIAYIGDLDSGATELSLPILNQAGILQITPGSGYPGLTDFYRGVTPNVDPGRYYPQSPHTLLRLIPNDVFQASAALSVLQSAGCQHFAIWEFGKSLESDALVSAIALTAPRYRMVQFKPGPLPGSFKDYQAYAYGLRNDIRCAIMVGHVTQAARVLTAQLRYQTGATVMGTNGLCNAGWVRGMSQILNRAEAKQAMAGLYCTTPALPVGKYAGTKGRKGFISVFYRHYHRKPNAYGYYGYQAAEMVIRALQDEGHDEDSRQQLLADLVDDADIAALGPFGFDHGDVASSTYGVDVFKNGVPTFHRSVTPITDLLSSGG